MGLAGYTDLRPLAEGLEFRVQRAVAPDGADVVLRTPIGGRFQSNANDPHVDTRALLRWEYAVTRHVARHGVPVARARELVIGETDALVSEYLPDDGAGVAPMALGRVLAALHRVPPLPRADGDVEGRIVRRWGRLRALAPEVGAPPDVRGTTRRGTSLLHLDVRAANLRAVGGAPLGLLDWSNAVVGDPALELGRLAEFARLAENRLDYPAVLAGYGADEPDDDAYAVYRLDAAVMLALVFLDEAPDATRAGGAVERVLELGARVRRIRGGAGSPRRRMAR